ncbi:hypothetical protein [Merismopedia glauca]|uniref:hypothetical protein n=1 Tax=Merismopedia glauca TaxID=292586 RepID=UPI0015E673C5|nr:hypothetical protein [Merismopedia glauca]
MIRSDKSEKKPRLPELKSISKLRSLRQAAIAYTYKLLKKTLLFVKKIGVNRT